MLKKTISHILVSALLLSFVSTSSVTAQTKTNPETDRITKLKTKLAKLGTGKNVRLEVKLSDNTKRTGYLSQVNENSFVLTDLKTGQNTEFNYANIADAKKPGLAAWTKIAIAGGIVIAVIVTWSVYCGNPDLGCSD